MFISDKEFYEARTKLTIETLKYQQLFEIVSTKIEHIQQKNEPNKFDLISDELTKYRAEIINFTKNIQILRNPLINFLENELKKMMKK